MALLKSGLHARVLIARTQLYGLRTEIHSVSLHIRCGVKSLHLQYWLIKFRSSVVHSLQVIFKGK